jgi:nucleoside-diphosphate-sugar epimerase
MINRNEQWRKVFDEDLQYIVSNCRSDLKKISNKSLLFTGGGGFLGYYFYHVITKWNKENKKNNIFYTVLDNKLLKKNSWITKTKNNQNIKFIFKDINSVSQKFIKDFDIIVHGASIASPTFYRKYPIETMKANIGGLWNILKSFESNNSTKNKLKKLIFFSSSEVYGNPDKNNIPTKEDYVGNVSFTGPRACYDESKRFGETLVLNYSNIYKFNSVIIRPFNNYGPGMSLNDKRIIPDLMKNVLDNEDMILFSNGAPKRTFCYIADSITSYIKAISKGKNLNVYNVGTSSPEISMKELTITIKDIAKSLYDYKGKCIFKINKDKEYLKDNPLRRKPCLKKTTKHLSFKSKISLIKGLKNTLIYFNNLKNR